VNQSILEIRALRVDSVDAESCRRRSLLSDVSLRVERGEVLGVIGKSGAGKSILGLAAMGYARPGTRITHGQIIFDGIDLAGLSQRALRNLRGARIAYIAQSPAAAFNPFKRLGRQVAEVLVLHRALSWRDATVRVGELFAELGLPEPRTFGLRFPHQVSGGQLQRAMVAMAVACGPDLLILDEPTTALDVTTQIEVLASIRACLKRHTAAGIFISHDLTVVAQFADRVTILKDGEVVETGVAADVINRPEAAYTRKLVTALLTRLELHKQPQASAESKVRPRRILSVTSLTAGYANAESVIRDISIDLYRGETLAIVGMSGSGKTTLAMAICGLLGRCRGSLSLNDKHLPSSMSQRSKQQLRQVQLIFQSPDTSLNPAHKIGMLLGRAVARYEGGSRNAVRSRVAELLKMVGLERDFAHRTPAQLSGGQKQRIGIARALAARPELIVCDEVTSSLDPIGTVEILTLLRHIQLKTGVAYLFVTHDLSVVKQIADHIAVMRDGEVVEVGAADKVLAAPTQPYTRFLFSSVPELRTDWLTDVLTSRDGALREGETPEQREGKLCDQVPP
jgi:peptide/nickel transport system ATP-binding protein